MKTKKFTLEVPCINLFAPDKLEVIGDVGGPVVIDGVLIEGAKLQEYNSTTTYINAQPSITARVNIPTPGAVTNILSIIIHPKSFAIIAPNLTS